MGKIFSVPHVPSANKRGAGLMGHTLQPATRGWYRYFGFTSKEQTSRVLLFNFEATFSDRFKGNYSTLTTLSCRHGQFYFATLQDSDDFIQRSLKHCYIICLCHMMSAPQGMIIQLPLARSEGAIALTEVCSLFWRHAPLLSKPVMQTRSFWSPCSGTQCPDRLEMRCGAGKGGPEVQRGRGRECGGLLCLRLLWPVQTGCELTAAHLRQPAEFTRSASFYSGGWGEKACGGNLALAEATDDLQNKVLPQGCISHREIQIHVS